MNVDFNKTLKLVTGGLTSPQQTWSDYLGENPSWQQTLVVLTAPLFVVSMVLTVLLSRMVGNFSPYGMGKSWFSAILFGLLVGAISFLVVVFAFNLLAGIFQGKPNFSRAFAAISLAAIPAWLAGIAGAVVPWVGPLISLAGAIVSLVFMYKIMPLALEVPGNRRTLHFVVSIVVIIVINLVIGGTLGVGRMGSEYAALHVGGSKQAGEVAPASGMFGQIGRQAALIAKASEDRYDPPGDGMVSPDQARWVADTLAKSSQAYGEEMGRLKSISEDLKDKENPSPADLVKMYQGMGSVVSLNSIEVEVVKSGGGNWAEYQWVKNQLRNARMQRGEGSDAAAHNYELYQGIPEELRTSL
jgi:Yip1 domain